jgi:molybdopterin-guanine dinucleotide biosynthesis protein A
MRLLERRATAAFVAATDMPMLHPDFVRSVAGALGAADVALPTIEGHNHPLAAVYRVSLLPKIEALLAADRLRPAFIWEGASLQRVDETAVAYPSSVRNVNTPDDLDVVRGLPLPLVAVEAYGTVRTRLGFARTEVRAATLGAALDALGWGRPRSTPSARHRSAQTGTDVEILVALNGERFRSDRSTALVDGDRLALLTQEAGG